MDLFDLPGYNLYFSFIVLSQKWIHNGLNRHKNSKRIHFKRIRILCKGFEYLNNLLESYSNTYSFNTSLGWDPTIVLLCNTKHHQSTVLFSCRWTYKHTVRSSSLIYLAILLFCKAVYVTCGHNTKVKLLLVLLGVVKWLGGLAAQSIFFSV